MNRSGSLLLLVILVLVSVPAFGQILDTPELPSDYVSDRCSVFPDGDWGECCVQHDKAYFFGGTELERKAADRKLFQCVRAKGGVKHRFMSDLMWLGVRIGGSAFLSTPFRWGFGRDWRPGSTGL